MDEVEALRRRLYRADASEEDQARYALLTRDAAPVPAPSRPPLRRRVPRIVIPAAVVVGLAATVLIGRSVATSARPVAEVRPTATATATASPEVAVATIDLAEPGKEIRGTGSAEVPVDVAYAAFGGRFSVLLSSPDARPLGWTARTLETRRDWSSYRKVIASSPTRDRLDATRGDVAAYVGTPPMWITVQAPADTTWTLTIAFGDATSLG